MFLYGRKSTCTCSNKYLACTAHTCKWPFLFLLGPEKLCIFTGSTFSLWWCRPTLYWICCLPWPHDGQPVSSLLSDQIEAYMYFLDISYSSSVGASLVMVYKMSFIGGRLAISIAILLPYHTFWESKRREREKGWDHEREKEREGGEWKREISYMYIWRDRD